MGHFSHQSHLYLGGGGEGAHGNDFNTGGERAHGNDFNTIVYKFPIVTKAIYFLPGTPI